jgi:hypothetical protein
MRESMAKPLGADIEEDLQLLDAKVKQAKFEYEQYFLGHRPREPVMTRGEVQKIIAYWSNLPIRNTKHRFRFNTLCARFFTFRRQWNEINRRIEEGTYEPHNKKARRRLEEAEAAARAPRPAAKPVPASPGADADICNAYLEARRSCGEKVGEADRARIAAQIEKQRKAILEKYACKAVRFRVVVEDGKARLKATPVRS